MQREPETKKFTNKQWHACLFSRYPPPLFVFFLFPSASLFSPASFAFCFFFFFLCGVWRCRFWHVCVGLFVYFWTGACNPPHVVQARKRLLFATASDALLLSSQEKKFKQIAKFSSSSSPLELCACPTPCPPLAPSRSDSRLSRETSLAK